MSKKKTEEIVKVEEVKEDIQNDEIEDLTLEERIINIEKKTKVSFWLNIITVVLIAFLLIMVLGSGNSSTAGGSGDAGSQEETVAYDTSAFKEISPADISNESKGKSIVVWVGRQTCGYCAMYAPYIKQAADNYGITAYYIDLATMINFNVENPYVTDATAYDTLRSLTGKGEWETFAQDNVGGTPLTLIIKDGKVIGGVSGAAAVDKIENVFSTAGLKKK